VANRVSVPPARHRAVTAERGTTRSESSRSISRTCWSL